MQEPDTAEQLRLSFSVPGVPVPGGSKKAWAIHAKGCPAARRHGAGPCVCKPRIALADVTGDRGKHWRAKTALAGAEAMRKAGLEAPIRGAIAIEVVFYMPRPKNHYGSGKNQLIVKNSAPSHMIFTPDWDKLVRSTQDALTAVIWEDDRQITDAIVRKRYAQRTPGAVINVIVL